MWQWQTNTIYFSNFWQAQIFSTLFQFCFEFEKISRSYFKKMKRTFIETDLTQRKKIRHLTLEIIKNSKILENHTIFLLTINIIIIFMILLIIRSSTVRFLLKRYLTTSHLLFRLEARRLACLLLAGRLTCLFPVLGWRCTRTWHRRGRTRTWRSRRVTTIIFYLWFSISVT